MSGIVLHRSFGEYDISIGHLISRKSSYECAYVVCPEGGGLISDIPFTNAQKDASSSTLAQKSPALGSSHRRQPAALPLFASGKLWLLLLNLYMCV